MIRQGFRPENLAPGSKTYRRFWAIHLSPDTSVLLPSAHVKGIPSLILTLALVSHLRDNLRSVSVHRTSAHVHDHGLLLSLRHSRSRDQSCLRCTIKSQKTRIKARMACTHARRRTTSVASVVHGKARMQVSFPLLFLSALDLLWTIHFRVLRRLQSPLPARSAKRHGLLRSTGEICLWSRQICHRYRSSARRL